MECPVRQESVDAPVFDWLRMIRCQTIDEDEIVNKQPVNVPVSTSVQDLVIIKLVSELAGQDHDMTNWCQVFRSCLNGPKPTDEDDQILNLVTNQSVGISGDGVCQIDGIESQSCSLESEEKVEAQTIENSQGVQLEDKKIEKRKRPSRLQSIPTESILRRISEVSCELSPELNFALERLIRYPFYDELVTRHLPTCIQDIYQHRYSVVSDPVYEKTQLEPSFQAQRKSWPVSTVPTTNQSENPVATITFHSQSEQLSEQQERRHLLACAITCQTLPLCDSVIWKTSQQRLPQANLTICANFAPLMTSTEVVIQMYFFSSSLKLILCVLTNCSGTHRWIARAGYISTRKIVTSRFGLFRKSLPCPILLYLRPNR